MSKRMMPWLNWSIATLFVVYQFIFQAVAGIMSHAWMEDFHIGKAKLGYLSSSFFISYVVLQIPVGIAYDRLGVRKVLMTASILLTSGIWGLAFSATYTQAILSRMLMGCGSAFGFVGMLYVTASWFRAKHFAMLVGIAETIAMLGVACGEFFMAMLVHQHGWRKTMQFAGIGAIILSILVFWLIRDRKPVRNSFREREGHMLADLKATIGRKQLWIAAFYGFSISTVINVFAVMWAVPYLLQKYPLLNLKMAGFACGLVFLGLAIGGPTNAWISQKLNRRKPILVYFGWMTAILFTIMLWVPMHFEMILIFLLALGFFSSSYIQIFASVKENSSKKLQGASLAFANMILMSSAPIIQASTGWMLSMNVSYIHSLMLMNILLYMAVVLSYFIREKNKIKKR